MIQDLLCIHCGEFGQLVCFQNAGYVVERYNGKLICCSSLLKPTEQEAIQYWQEMQRDPELYE